MSPPTWRHQSGIGLIEILVAVLVLSIGILGIAALQTRALTSNGNAAGRSLATVESYSILEAMRADRANALAGIYNQTVTANACPAAGTTLAGYQINAWCTALGKSLGAIPTTTGQVNCDANGNCTITVTWNDSRSKSTAGGGTQTLTTVAGL